MTFDLSKLGWHGFQRLCSTIARECFGQTVQLFLDSNDGGRDGAFTGTWIPQSGEALSGQFVIQCKFTSKPGYTLRLSDVSDEVAKAQRLAQRGHCDTYILLTNAGISGRFDEEFSERLRRAGINAVRTYGADWICQQIQERKRLRMLVPSLYGLGDLSEILDERAYDQASALLEALREDLARVVMTESYHRAATALETHGFVLLLGEPAAGKTTVASMLAMAAIDQWDSSTLKLDQPAEVVHHWNPTGHSQFFWVDDAFGVTQYEPLLVHGWNHVFAQVKTMLRGGAKVVMTSRDYIYNRARQDLKHSSFPLLAESQMVIDVQALSLDEKRQILYNHLKLGKQPREFRASVKPYLEALAKHPRFVPETARRLADPTFTKNVRGNRTGLLEFAENQREFLLELLTGLDPDSKAGLALIFMRNGALESPVNLDPSEMEVLNRLGSALGKALDALEAMRGNLAKHVVTGDVSMWRFKHPTVGDAFAEMLLRNPELLGIYVQGAPIRQLLSQVTCGDLGFENAVRVPRPLFPHMLRRLEGVPSLPRDRAGWSGQAILDSFLARRCGKEFLEVYMSKFPETLDRITSPWVYIAAESGVEVVIRLFSLGVLPDPARRHFLQTVTGHAFEHGDPEALTNAGIREMFTIGEWQEFRTRVRREHASFLEHVRHGYQECCSDNVDPSEALQPFMDLCEAMDAEFAGDAEVEVAIQRERKRANSWLEDEWSDRPPEDEDYDSERYRSYASNRTHEGARSIFDDVDS
jgi:hypothetical protein